MRNTIVSICIASKDQDFSPRLEYEEWDSNKIHLGRKSHWFAQELQGAEWNKFFVSLLLLVQQQACLPNSDPRNGAFVEPLPLCFLYSAESISFSQAIHSNLYQLRAALLVKLQDKRALKQEKIIVRGSILKNLYPQKTSQHYQSLAGIQLAKNPGFLITYQRWHSGFRMLHLASLVLKDTRTWFESKKFRDKLTAAGWKRSESSWTSSLLSFMLNAATFCSKYLTRFVPEQTCSIDKWQKWACMKHIAKVEQMTIKKDRKRKEKGRKETRNGKDVLSLQKKDKV